jgi:hypothetical protein
MTGAVHIFAQLESRGWKSAGGTAIIPDGPQSRFYSGMLTRFAKRGAAEVWQLRYGDRVVACDLCITHDATLIVLKTTYDEAEADTSPAALMRYHALQELYAERRMRRLEFYGPMMDWHKRLTDKSRLMYHRNIYRWDWLKSLRSRTVARCPPVNPAESGQSAD